jgi:DNA-binding transcriptional ArsR family regulator
MHRWNAIFRAFGNINKMRIVKLLSSKDRLPVGEIAKEIDISFRATSKHLIELAKLGVLVSKGRDNRVYYSLNPQIPKDFKKAIKLFLE